MKKPPPTYAGGGKSPCGTQRLCLQSGDITAYRRVRACLAALVKLEPRTPPGAPAWLSSATVHRSGQASNPLYNMLSTHLYTLLQSHSIVQVYHMPYETQNHDASETPRSP